jgi:hypothetical protein
MLEKPDWKQRNRLGWYKSGLKMSLLETGLIIMRFEILKTFFKKSQ